MWIDENQDWGGVGTAYEQPRTDATLTSSLAGEGQAVDNSGTGSGWTGFLQQGLGAVLAYGLARDKAQSQAEIAMQQRQALTMQPLVSSANGGFAISKTALAVMGGFALVVVLLMKKG